MITVIRELMQKNASVCLQQAKLGYAACLESAEPVAGMAHFKPYCLRRAERLPDVRDPLAG